MKKGELRIKRRKEWRSRRHIFTEEKGEKHLKRITELQ